jgi:restriction system protein
VDYSPIVHQVLRSMWWIFPLTVIIGILRLPIVKGYFGELIVRLLAHWRLDKSIYHPVHNVTLATPDGTTQIDHVFVSRFGIFVVETKNMQGWIFGGANQAQWTQKIYKKSYKFQNPLRQN